MIKVSLEKLTIPGKIGDLRGPILAMKRRSRLLACQSHKANWKKIFLEKKHDKNLLVELGLEELPAYVVTPSEKQLGEKMAAFLDDNRLSYESIQTFSTPRRLAIRVIGLADQQSDLTEDFKGPSKKIALDADGNFSKAAQGFVRGKGLTVDDIEFREVKGEEYVYVTKHEAGKPAKEVLAGLPEVLASLTFPC